MSDLISTPDDERVQAIRERLAMIVRFDDGPIWVLDDLDYLLRENDALAGSNAATENALDKATRSLGLDTSDCSTHAEEIARIAAHAEAGWQHYATALKDEAELSTARAALAEAETRVESLTKQLETRLGELFPLRRGADVLAARVNEMVDRGVLSARSPAADAMLDYAQTRYGQDRAIECVRNVSARLAAASASAPSGESQPHE